MPSQNLRTPAENTNDKKLRIRFSRSYFLLTLVLLAVETLIALFLDDKIVRPYVGDMLVVVLLYCFIKTFLNSPVFITALSVLLFACFIEVLQYVEIVNRLGLRDSAVASTIIGTSFDLLDMIAYTTGFLVIIFTEKH